LCIVYSLLKDSFWGGGVPLYSGSKSVRFDAGTLCDASDRHAIDLDGVAAIVEVVPHGDPSAVPRLVVAVGVQAIKRCAIRLVAHVHDELVIGLPLRADLDPPTSVVGPGHVV
jgi:hypothetical protein